MGKEFMSIRGYSTKHGGNVLILWGELAGETKVRGWMIPGSKNWNVNDLPSIRRNLANGNYAPMAGDDLAALLRWMEKDGTDFSWAERMGG